MMSLHWPLLGSVVSPAYLAASLTLGIAVGVQALIARRTGESAHAQIIQPLNAGLLIAFISGAFLTALFLFLSPHIVSLMNSDTTVRTIATDYLDYRILGVIPVGINFAFRGFWNGISQSLTYLKVLLAVHACNLLVSYCLIFGEFGFPEMGAAGSGLGTTISLYIGSVLYVALTISRFPRLGLLRDYPGIGVFKTLIRLALPNSIQQFFAALSVSCFITILGLLGVRELAVGHAIVNISLFLILPGSGMGIAATTLVGRAIGARNIEDAYNWGWDVVKLSAPMLFVLGAPLVLFPGAILQLFLQTTRR